MRSSCVPTSSSGGSSTACSRSRAGCSACGTAGFRARRCGIPPWKCTISTAAASGTAGSTRSEEHTSELQSQSNLVCRLLLEKKKKDTITLHQISCDAESIRQTQSKLTEQDNYHS